MNHYERDIFNGHVYSIDPHEEPSNEELGIVPYSPLVRSLIWFGLCVAAWFLVALPVVLWLRA
jgi:hypothetical protein